MACRLALLLTLVFIGSSTSWACSRNPSLPPLTPEMQFSDAASVVVGHLTKVEEVKPPNLGKGDAGLIEGTFRPSRFSRVKSPPTTRSRARLSSLGTAPFRWWSGPTTSSTWMDPTTS